MLPIGSIVYLKEGTSKLMILNRGPLMYTEHDGRKMFDYSGCLYPRGMDSENVFYFNTENTLQHGQDFQVSQNDS